MKNLALTLALTAAISCGNEKAQQNTQPDQTEVKNKVENVIEHKIPNNHLIFTKEHYPPETRFFNEINGELGQVPRITNTKDSVFGELFNPKTGEYEQYLARPKTAAEIQKEIDDAADKQRLIEKYNLIDPSQKIKTRRIIPHDQLKFAPSLNIDRAETDDQSTDNHANEVNETEESVYNWRSISPLNINLIPTHFIRNDSIFEQYDQNFNHKSFIGMATKADKESFANFNDQDWKEVMGE